MFVNLIGEIKQSISNHFKSTYGCTKCSYQVRGKEKRNTLEDFIKKAKALHGENTYNYSKFVYVNNKVNGIIICNTCDHEWNCRPDTHIGNKSGCPKCHTPVIYTKAYYQAKGIEDHHCNLYIIKFRNEVESFLKVGITKHDKIKYRFRGLKNYTLEILHTYPLMFFKAFEIEQYVLDSLIKSRYIPEYTFKGHTETLSNDCYENILSLITEKL